MQKDLPHPLETDDYYNYPGGLTDVFRFTGGDVGADGKSQTPFRNEDTVIVDMEKIFGGLPRQFNVFGKDDTTEIRELCVRSFPQLYYCPNQRENRRKLYMAIYKARQTTKGWIYETGAQTPIDFARNQNKIRSQPHQSCR